MSIVDLIAAIPGARLFGQECKISGVSYDSRRVQPGDLFAGLRGGDFDGHEFMADAERHGAAALLVQMPVDSPLPQIVVEDSRAALAAVADAFFDHPSREIGVIGITGTDGKTTTTYILDHILGAAGLRTGMIGTIAIRIGGREDLHASRQTTPESLDVQRYLRQMADNAVDWAILEATSHGLAMNRLDHVHFRVAAVTNITHEHLDFHGSVENYRRAKAILVERVAAEAGTVVLNADDPGARAIESFARGASLIRYGVKARAAEIRALDVRSSAAGSQFVLDANSGGSATVVLPLVGSFNVANAVCAAAIALSVGVEFNQVVAAMECAPPVPGRMTRIDEGQSFSVIVDYAHTPDSLEKVLSLLRGLHPKGRLIAVFGSAGERDVEKRPLQGAVAARLADMSVITSEDPRFEDAEAIIEQIAAGAESAGARRTTDLFTRTDRREAMRLAFELARPGDCVLLAGKGHEGSIIWGREKRPWDEAGVARELLSEAGYAGARA